MPRIDQFRFYANALKKHGVSARGVAWADRQRQQRRFAALVRATGSLREYSVTDAGCGTGALWFFLQEQAQTPKKYTGLDTHPDMVRAARESTGQTILRRDILTDTLPESDWYLLSGTLNLLTRFETLLAIKRCADAARVGMVFNLLKGRDTSPTYNYWLPKEIKKACAALGRVRIDEGYLEGDMTVRITF
jgi:SAM-dependent methyltransferase